MQTSQEDLSLIHIFWLRRTAAAAGLSARPVAYTRFSGRRGRVAFESPALLELSPLLHRESRFLHVYVGTAFCQQPADTPATVGAVPVSSTHLDVYKRQLLQ